MHFALAYAPRKTHASTRTAHVHTYMFTPTHPTPPTLTDTLTFHARVAPGYVTTIQTRGGEHHHQAWLTTSETTAVVAKVTACSNTYAMFTPYFGHDAAMYEIGLGESGNTKTIIKKDYVVVRQLRQSHELREQRELREFRTEPGSELWRCASRRVACPCMSTHVVSRCRGTPWRCRTTSSATSRSSCGRRGSATPASSGACALGRNRGSIGTANFDRKSKSHDFWFNLSRSDSGVTLLDAQRSVMSMRRAGTRCLRTHPGVTRGCCGHRAGDGATPYENEFISWTDPDETKYEISAISLASGSNNVKWEFNAPTAGLCPSPPVPARSRPFPPVLARSRPSPPVPARPRPSPRDPAHPRPSPPVPARPRPSPPVLYRLCGT